MSSSKEPKPANKILGQIIKNKREEKKLTQKQLAQIIGIPEQTIAGMESGRRPPTPVMRRTLCKEFGIENLLSFDTDIDLCLLNLIQETLELFSLNENELDFIIDELKVSFGFDIEHITLIEDIFDKQRKKIKSINKERHKYIKFVIQYILDIIYSLYRIGDKKRLYGSFSYFLLHFYKQEFEDLVKFPTEYKVMLNKEDIKSKKYYSELENKENVLKTLTTNFNQYAKNNWFLDDNVYKFDIENNEDIYIAIRGKINGYYYNNYISNNKIHNNIQMKDWIKDYTKYNNEFKEFGTVYEFQILMLKTLERIEKSYILHNNAIPIHILPKYNIIDGYENLDIKWASDKYEYIAMKVDKSLAYKYTFKENDVITIQIGNNYTVGDDIFVWSKKSGFNFGELVSFNKEDVWIKNRLGEYKYKIIELFKIGIIAKVNKIYYKNINDNLKKICK